MSIKASLTQANQLLSILSHSSAHQLRAVTENSDVVKLLPWSNTSGTDKSRVFEALGLGSPDQVGRCLENIESMEQAAAILGENNFFGPAEVMHALGLDIPLCEIPPLKASTNLLIAVKRLDLALVLRVQKNREQGLLTIDSMAHVGDHAKSREYLVKATPRLGWAIISKGPIPLSCNKNLLEQTDFVETYLCESLFDRGPLPENLRDVFAEYREMRATLEELTHGDTSYSDLWHKFIQVISTLRINALVRPTCVEIVYDHLVYAANTGTRLMSRMEGVWTSTIADEGKTMLIFEDIDGLSMGGLSPYIRNKRTGSYLSFYL